MTPVESQPNSEAHYASIRLKARPANSSGCPSSSQITESAKTICSSVCRALPDFLNKWGIDWKELLPQNSIFLVMPFVVRSTNIYYSMRDSSNPIYLDAFSIKEYNTVMKPLTRNRKQESLRKRKNSSRWLALERWYFYSADTATAYFEFDHDFYKSLDTDKADHLHAIQESIHPEDREDFIQHKHLLDAGFLRKITRRRYNFNGKGIYGGNSDMRKRRMDKTPPRAIMSE